VGGPDRRPGFAQGAARSAAAALRYLVDTHVWAWSLVEPERLPKRALAVLEDASSEGWLSPISVWEMLLLIERGRLEADALRRLWERRT